MEPDLSYCPHCNRSVSNDWWHEPDCPSRQAVDLVDAPPQGQMDVCLPSGGTARVNVRVTPGTTTLNTSEGKS